MQTNNYVFVFTLFSVIQLWNYTKTIIPLRLSENNSLDFVSGLFDDIHFAFSE